MWVRLLLIALLAAAFACSRNDGEQAGNVRTVEATAASGAIPIAVPDGYQLPKATKAQDVRSRRYLVIGASRLSAGVLPDDDGPGVGTFPGEAVELEQVGERMTDLADRLRLAAERGIAPADIDLAELRAREEARKKAEAEALARAEAERKRAEEAQRRAADEAARLARDEARKAAEEMARMAAAQGDEDQAEAIAAMLATLDEYDTGDDALGGVVGGLAYDPSYQQYQPYQPPGAPPVELLRPQAFGDDRPVLAADASLPLVRLAAILARLCGHGAHLAVSTPASEHAVQHPVALGTLRAGTCEPAAGAGSGYWAQEGRRIVLELGAEDIRLLEDEYSVAARPEIVQPDALATVVRRARAGSHDYGGAPTLWIIASDDARVADLIELLDVAGAEGVSSAYLADRAAWTRHQAALADRSYGGGGGWGTIGGGTGAAPPRRTYDYDSPDP